MATYLRHEARPIRSGLRFTNSSRASPGPDGMLPVWSKWFASDKARAALVGIDILARNEAAYAQFEDGLPRMLVGWFDEAIELAAWDHIPARYVNLVIYDHATAEAQRRGWPKP